MGVLCRFFLRLTSPAGIITDLPTKKPPKSPGFGQLNGEGQTPLTSNWKTALSAIIVRNSASNYRLAIERVA